MAMPGIEYLREVGNEMKKVTWPTREQLQESTVVTIVTCAIITLFVFVVDQVFTQIFTFLF